MSEILPTRKKRTEALTTFCKALISGQPGKPLVDKYQDLIDTVTPHEAMAVLDRLLEEGIPVQKVKEYTGKILNLFYKSLNAYRWDKPGEGHFLFYLMAENDAVKAILKQMKKPVAAILKGSPDQAPQSYKELKQLLSRLKEYELHYIKKENILFPYIERTFSQYRCLQIMWSFHDDFRQSMRLLEELLASDKPDKDRLNREIGKLYFVVLPIIFREEQIVFPVAIRAIPAHNWEEMLRQSVETGYCYIDPPVISPTGAQSEQGLEDHLADLGTGRLSVDQIKLILETLPLEVTFVDENDEVRYFSHGRQRIFPRSKAVIGRKVQNCHPPESIHIVNRIVESFKSGKKDHADFRIHMKDRYILIRYFAVRDKDGQYRGTLEVSQDITEIHKLEGEQRLLDWDDV